MREHEVGEMVEVYIFGHGLSGAGLGELDGKPIFVWRVPPGTIGRVRCRITKKNKDYYEAEFIESLG